MKEMLLDSSTDGPVTEARKAYRNVLARHGLLNFSQPEVDTALAALQSQGTGRIGAGDIRFQAAVTRLKSRKGTSPQVVEGVLQELLDAEYDCDQAEWERDCHRWACLTHLNFRMPRFTPHAAAPARGRPAAAHHAPQE